MEGETEDDRIPVEDEDGEEHLTDQPESSLKRNRSQMYKSKKN
jgi:hypothetical protein